VEVGGPDRLERNAWRQLVGAAKVVSPRMRYILKSRRGLTIWCVLLLFSLLLVVNHIGASGGHRGSQPYSCAEAHPHSMCNAANTCGTASSPCRVDVKRRGSNWASTTPSIPGAKENAIFCVKAGTTVIWESSSKNTGFVIDFGPASPFDTPGAIIGGADRPISVVAKRAGCFKYSTGACTSGTIYGMCGSTDNEVVVTGAAD
jgi:hypothetical protein